MPGKQIGIEYQGLQHFQPVDFFGGKEAFEKTKKRDKKKAEICKKNNVKLIYFKHGEIITRELIIRKLKGK